AESQVSRDRLARLFNWHCVWPEQARPSMSKKSHNGCNYRFGPLDWRSLEFDPPLSMRLS
ncbi:MAG: hypothetical protein ACN6OQ_04080, partial [Paraburkholderia nemoris]